MYNLPISILKLHIADQKIREAELEAAKLQKLNKITNATKHDDYDSSFESFNDYPSFSKMNQKRTSSKSSLIEEEILETIQTDGSKKEKDMTVPAMKSKSTGPVKSNIRQLLNAVVETIPVTIKRAPQPKLQDSKETPTLALKDADLKFKLVSASIIILLFFRKLQNLKWKER